MADNIPTKSTKTNDKPKQSNVIHRTTTETIRLGETESVPISNSVNNSVVNNQRKKPCSFQITSVIVGRINNDGGDDSADDLDESHADDISDVNSRITDNETPSYSEDTYSKEDIFFNVSSSSLCSAPVIPTSAQYGLAIVSPGTTGNPANKDNSGSAHPVTTSVNTIDLNVSVANIGSEHTITSQLHEQQNKDMQSTPGRNDRFKVVKIESTEPFKRGRWSCMDFLDSANQPYSLACTRADGNASLQVSTAIYTSESSTMADFPNANNIPTAFQQQTQSLPPQQLNQNLVQTNPVHVPQSQTQYYAPQQVQNQGNLPHMQAAQQPFAQQAQAQYSVQQPTQQIGHQNMMVQPGTQSSIAGGYAVSQPTSGPVQQVAHNVVGNQGQMSQMGIVQGQVMTQQNIGQGQAQNSSSVVTQPAMPYSQQSSSFPPTSSSVQMPSQYVAQSQTFSTQSSQQHMIPQQSVYNPQPVPSNVPSQGQSYSGNQGQSYSSQPSQIVNNGLPAQGQSYAGQLSQVISGSVPAQGQSYGGQPSQIVSNLATGQTQTYSTHQGQTQTQSFASQQTQTTYAQPVIQQTPYVQQQNQSQQTGLQQQSNIQQQGQGFQAQGQAYVSQQQASYQGVPPAQMYTQNVTGMSNSQQSQNYVVSMPSSPASVPQQPIYPSASQGATTEQQSYAQQQQQSYVPTTAQQHILSNVGNFPSQGQSYSAVGNVVPQSSYPTGQANVSVQGTYRQGSQSRTLPAYSSSQFKPSATTSGDGPSPSEAPPVVPQETPVEPTGINEETQAPPDDADWGDSNNESTGMMTPRYPNPRSQPR